MIRWLVVAAMVGLAAAGTAGWLPAAVAQPAVEARVWRSVPRTPAVYLIGRDGRLLGRAIGPRTWTQPPGRASLAALLRPAPVPAP